MAMVSISDSNLLPFFSFHQLTPLHRAARRGRENIVEYFVQKGVGIDSGDNEQVYTWLIKCLGWNGSKVTSFQSHMPVSWRYL